MEKIKVWTKQHKNVLAELEKTGRYTAKRRYISMDLQEHAGLVLEVYDWAGETWAGRSKPPAGCGLPGMGLLSE